MPSFPRALVRRFEVAGVLTLACLVPPCRSQMLTIVEGPAIDQLTVRVIDTSSVGSPSQHILTHVAIRPAAMTGRTSNDRAELRKGRILQRNGLERIERPDSGRLFVFERTQTSGHGLLFVPPDGQARIVFEGSEQLDTPIALATDGQHAVFAKDPGNIFVVRLDGSTFASTGTAWRTVAVGSEIEESSLMVGTSHVFFVTGVNDTDMVHRCALADGGLPENITPPGSMPEQNEEIAMSADGSVVAFLRGADEEAYRVFVASVTGPARQLALPPREYKEIGYIPSGIGHPHLVLNDDGSRLMVTEVRSEDELLYVETHVGGAAFQVTGDATFAPYLGVHILPRFIGNKLFVASGHHGWMDWYAMQPDGFVLNVTQTGSPEAPFLLGALDIRHRYPLANDRMLSSESIGVVQRLRLLDADGFNQVLFADLMEEPSVGTAFAGPADLRVVGLGGERIVSGLDGTVRIVLPPGLHLTDPVRSANGWIASYLHLDGGLGLPIVQLPDGTLLVGGLATSKPQMSFGLDGALALLWPDRLQVLGATGIQTLMLPAMSVRVVASGAGG